jgi:hypothetical protein
LTTEATWLAEARLIAAAHVRRAGRDDIGQMIVAGQGDDFPEVEIALATLRTVTGTIERFERALSAYADRDFWGDGDCHAALAFHDQGEIARAALAGTDILAYTAG